MGLAVKAGRLIDGTGAAPVENVYVLIDGERMTGVLAPGEKVPDGYDELDASQYTVIPGMIDAHLHIQGSGDPRDRSFGPAEVTRSIPSIALTCYQNSLKDLEAGFTTLRDASCRHYADVALRNAINGGQLPGPRLWVCGLGITSTAGHMDREKYLAPHIELPGPSTIADGPVEARRAVRLNLRNDVDFIKINATLTEHVRRYSGYCAPEMTRETMEAIFEEAHWHGRRVTAHCYGGPAATWAIEGGIDGIEHGFYLSDEQLDMMAERDITLSPNLSVPGKFRWMRENGISSGNPLLDAWRTKAIDNAWNMVSRAHERGIRIIAGTDSAMPYVLHGKNAFELEMLVEAGLSPMEALVAATGDAAVGIGFPDVGTIAAEKYADLVLVDGNPLDDIRILQDLARISMVIKGGEVVIDRRGGTEENAVRKDGASSMILNH